MAENETDDESIEDGIQYKTDRQVWVLQYRSRGSSKWSWTDLTEVTERPLEELEEAKDRTPKLNWRLIRRTDEEVIVPDGPEGLASP